MTSKTVSELRRTDCRDGAVVPHLERSNMDPASLCFRARAAFAEFSVHSDPSSRLFLALPPKVNAALLAQG